MNWKTNLPLRLVTFGLLASQWLVGGQSARSQETNRKNPPGNINWQTDPLWKDLHINSVKKSKVKEKFVSAPIEVTFYQTEPGLLACAGNLDTHISAATKKAWDERTELSYNDVQIMLFDLAGKTAEGVPVTSYTGRAMQPSLWDGWYPSTLSTSGFSPDGRYLMLGFDLNISATFPFWLDIKTGEFNTLTTTQAHNTTPAHNGAIWNPDDRHIATFSPPVNFSGAEEGANELDQPNIFTRVNVQDWQSKTRKKVAEEQGIKNLAWLNAQTLLYDALPGGFVPPPRDGTAKTGQVTRPDIYSYSLLNQNTKLLITDGYSPTPSPDGQWIAFFGSSDPKNPQPLQFEPKNPMGLWRYICAGASLCVAKSDGTGRFALQPFSDLYPRVQWLPDSKQFVTIERTKSFPVFEADVSLWNVEAQTVRKLATLETPASESKAQSLAGLGNRLNFPFSPMGVSADGKKIYVASIPSISSVRFPNTLQSIDVETGQVFVIATIQGTSQFSWKPT